MRTGLDITEGTGYVGMCYSMWFNAISVLRDEQSGEPITVPMLEEQYGFSTEKGFGSDESSYNRLYKFHYWGKPQGGFYKSDDKAAHKRSLVLLEAAGVDFLILDYTNCTASGCAPGTKARKQFFDLPCTALFTAMDELKAEGHRPPRAVFWTRDPLLFDCIYEQYYTDDRWRDHFVYWNGKPLILGWDYSEKAMESRHFTVRFMYGLQYRVFPCQWSYLEHDTARVISYDDLGAPEQMSASVAAQTTYLSLRDETAHGRDKGRFWHRQWENAFRVHPKILTVAWWNEWVAQLYRIEGVGYIFTDNFNTEYSRDIEPMEGGHGDAYYQRLCQYIKAYKSGESCPAFREL